MISEDLGHPELIFNKINRRSKLNDMIRKTIVDGFFADSKPCVEIKLPDDYET